MSVRRFTLFHLSLVQVTQPDFETYSVSREDWLRRSLKEPRTFPYRGGRSLYWVPLETDGDCIFGLLQLQRSHEHHKPPNEGGVEVVSEEWQGAYVLIDPTTHEHGQRAAVENDDVGKPSTLLTSLIRHINKDASRPYQIEADQIFDSEDFWRFARKNGNVLRSVSFDFVVPNMWDTSGDIDRDLRDTGHETGAERVRVGMTSSVGITTENKTIREGVEYSQRGAGKITAKSLEGKSFSSSKKPTTTEIPLTKGGRSEILASLKSLKNRILGHGQDPSVGGTDSAGDDSGSN